MQKSSGYAVHDSAECGFNYRAQRVLTHKLAYNPETNGSSIPFANDPTLEKEFNGQVQLENDKLTIQLFNKDNNKGLYFDDLLPLLRTLSNSLRPSQEREMSQKLLMACSLLEDKRAARVTDNFSESQIERDNPPNPNLLMPSQEEWMKIYDFIKST
ncbi:MAG: hypothetical protein Terrestrivirus1_5 [Terrestrivirus sp.]|uniref:Uncharacterized protein n=1 Tax=Terrestrivirus sp. TaxID=2487775 RepID=A0A3G4ZM69_9VIRU|nr:MAG: hypothetical protein Terrestrivirus1_5 [Terrestrivirus sp.]